jgi:hypothetical protein
MVYVRRLYHSVHSKDPIDNKSLMWVLAIIFGVFKYLIITLPLLLGNGSSLQEHLLALVGLLVGIVFNYWFLWVFSNSIKVWNNK